MAPGRFASGRAFDPTHARRNFDVASPGDREQLVRDVGAKKNVVGDGGDGAEIDVRMLQREREG